jgi:hypothetical protein
MSRLPEHQEEASIIFTDSGAMVGLLTTNCKTFFPIPETPVAPK